MEEHGLSSPGIINLKVLPKHHMRTLLPFCLAIIIIAVVGGCGRNANDRLLDSIETAIADNPDSALAALDTLDTILLQSAGDKARYHLVMAEARYKSGIDDTTINHVSPRRDILQGPQFTA